jgi:hypothetical protein
MKKLFTIIAAAAIMVGCGTAIAHTPPGQNDSCHGANLASCRPDPQPSHGHDCDHPNGNPIGNDDHCSPTPSETPSESPSEEPSTEPSSEPSTEPSAEPTPSTTLPPAVTITPPPTDTE